MTVITIGRQFGSGGRELGKKLAAKLGFAYYDREIITEISKKTDLPEAYVEKLLDTKPSPVYPMSSSGLMNFAGESHFSMSNAVYAEQAKLIKEIAARENCVIVGRCADYILRKDDPLKIFAYAPIEKRVARCMAHLHEEEVGMTEKEMQKRILEKDKARRKYYRFFTGHEWGDMDGYDLCLNTAVGTIDDWVDFLVKAVKEKET